MPHCNNFMAADAAPLSELKPHSNIRPSCRSRFTRAGLPGYLRQSDARHLIRESREAETLVEFEGDKREAIALPIEKVRALIDRAMSTMATTPFGRSPR
jgi:hypothetical protein